MLKEQFIPESSIQIDPKEHYIKEVGPIEHEELEECAIDIRNIGWTLGNDCPYRCKHCYSMSAREKGADLSTGLVDRIVDELSRNNVETVNLGGNEPLFTNGLNPKNTLLPYIIDSLVDRGIVVGLTTSGVTLIQLEKKHFDSMSRLNDVDVSFDSPYESEHNKNRGAKIYYEAIKALEICRDNGIPHTVVICGMSWNFTPDRLDAFIELARKYDANIRINPIKTVELGHYETKLEAEQYYQGFERLMEKCDIIDLGEPPLGTVTDFEGAKGCPCGRTSFRIHSITPDGKVPVSPCVYLHDYKVGDLGQDALFDIVRSPQFRTFRRRNANPEMIQGCENCNLSEKCRGGCAARSYLHNAHETGARTLFVKDPYCPKDVNPKNIFPLNPVLPEDITLVHRDYLCTWIGRPKL